MHKSIFIAGMPGSGKSTICKALKKLWYTSYDIETIDGLFSKRKQWKKPDNKNLESVKKTERRCNKEKLQEFINKNTEGIVFYWGNGNDIEEIFPLFDTTFLLKVSAKELCKRLSTRKWNDFGRTPEIQKRIVSWKDKREDDMGKKWAIPINAEREIWEIINDILEQSQQ